MSDQSEGPEQAGQTTQPSTRAAPPVKRSTLHEGQGNCLWKYEKGSWVRIKDSCAPGHECGGPPQREGTYEGEVLSKACQRTGK
jgi:hypothetical protein